MAQGPGSASYFDEHVTVIHGAMSGSSNAGGYYEDERVTIVPPRAQRSSQYELRHQHPPAQPSCVPMPGASSEGGGGLSALSSCFVPSRTRTTEEDDEEYEEEEGDIDDGGAHSPPLPPLPEQQEQQQQQQPHLPRPMHHQPSDASGEGSSSHEDDVGDVDQSSEGGSSSKGSSSCLPEWQTWEPPVACPLPRGGYKKLRFGPRTHYYLMMVISLCTIGSGLVYLGWKTYTILSSIGTLAFAPTPYMFLVLEWILFLSSLMLLAEICTPMRDRPAIRIPETGPFPLTNIFICCCGEPVDIIADTITGAMHQVYPPDRYTVWVLDDGKDPNLKAHVEGEAAEKYGHDRLVYLSRPKMKGVPHHFKAGNINHGLNHASGEFVAILDADMIPSPYFLTSLLPHFTSENIAFVQCPQSFYNTVRGDPLNDCSKEYYNVLLPYRDGRNSVQCVGTGAIFRISALRQNGGFTVGTITEDYDTAMSLHSQGYDSVYVNQKLQAGLAPWTLEAYVKQHQRWATGSLQLLLQRKPLMIKDKRFTFLRRMSYWWAGAQYYLNLVVLCLFTLPLLILAFDLPIMPLGSPAKVTRMYLILLTPYVLFSRLASTLMSARMHDSDKIMIRSEQPWVWGAWYLVVAIFKFFFPLISKQFEATGAKKHVEKNVIQRLGIVWFHLLFCSASVGICVFRLVTAEYNDCTWVLKLGGWVACIMYTAQTMSVPIWHVLLSPWHPKPDKRKEYLSYTKDGVPYYTPEQVDAPHDWRMVFFHVIPVLWFCLMGFFCYAAVTDFRPSFCQTSGFFGYERF